jgi:hypothetical protein
MTDRRQAPASTSARATAGGRTFGQQHPRHPAVVTADRLGDAVTRWADKFDNGEKDMIGMIIHALEQIAEGDR